MEYSLDIEINLPRDQVVALFRDQEKLSKWQPGLISIAPLSGEPEEVGAKTRLIHKMGTRKIEMVETVEVANLPDEMILVYEAKGVWNRCINRFVVLSAEQTLWNFETEFRCNGWMRVMVFLMPGLFKKQSRADLQHFKEFVEGTS